MTDRTQRRPLRQDDRAMLSQRVAPILIIGLILLVLAIMAATI